MEALLVDKVVVFGGFGFVDAEVISPVARDMGIAITSQSIVLSESSHEPAYHREPSHQSHGVSSASITRTIAVRRDDEEWWKMAFIIMHLTGIEI